MSYRKHVTYAAHARKPLVIEPTLIYQRFQSYCITDIDFPVRLVVFP